MLFDMDLKRLQARFADLFLVLLALGLFVQLSGKVWLESGSARNTQVYILMLLPALLFAVNKVCSRERILPSISYLPWLGFIAWVALSAFWSVDSDSSALSLAKRGIYIACYLLAIFLLYVRSDMLLLGTLRVGVFVIAIGALATIIYQFGFLDKPLAYRAFRLDRLGVGDFANYGWPVAAGIFHGAIAVWALGFALDRNLSFKASLFWLVVFFVLVAYVLLTYTRGAWIALVIASVVSIIMHHTRRGWLFMAGGGVLSLGFVISFWSQIIFEFSERRLSGRGAIWDYFLHVMNGHWVVGHGLGTPFRYEWPNGWAVSPHAHSLYLQQIYDSGLVGLSLLMIGVALLSYSAWKHREHYWVKLAYPALIFALFAMLTDVERIFTRPGDYWTVFWLPVALLLAIQAHKVSGAK
ncbi:O-antigen ligase family protein [Pseudomonas urmiensis]|uniref:O-antigen ligase family protein n=1 Tax=Pseudomonas urmiensis TaxID=2745493 RepID=UPI003D116A4D